MTLKDFFNPYNPSPFLILCSNRGEVQRMLNYINAHAYYHYRSVPLEAETLLHNAPTDNITFTPSLFMMPADSAVLSIPLSEIEDFANNNIRYYVGHDKHHYPICVGTEEQDTLPYNCNGVRVYTEEEYEVIRPQLIDMGLFDHKKMEDSLWYF